jgi:hypothetical protein
MPRSLTLDAEYNRGARDMAMLILDHLEHNGGSICNGLNKKQKLQFIGHLRNYLSHAHNSLKTCRNALPQIGWNFTFHYDDKKNLIRIEPTK